MWGSGWSLSSSSWDRPFLGTLGALGGEGGAEDQLAHTGVGEKSWIRGGGGAGHPQKGWAVSERGCFSFLVSGAGSLIFLSVPFCLFK